VGGAGESRVESGAGAPQAVGGCVLEFDADAAARGVSDGLFGLLVEVVVPQAARGGGGGAQGGEVGRYTGASGDPPVRQRRTWPRSTRRTVKGSMARMRTWKGCRTQGGRLGKGGRKEMSSLMEVIANVSAGIDRKANMFGWQAHLSDLSAAAEGSNLLSTIAPSTPMYLPSRSSSVMLFSRSEASGIPQKSVIVACSSTTVARWLAASPVMLLWPTL
jgi:hypothetical protein